MDVTKVLNLLVERKLFLSSVFALRVDDPFEGSPTILEASIAKSLREDENFAKEFLKKMFSQVENLDTAREFFARLMHDDIEDFAKVWFINCWHSSEHESAALWKIYADGNGVAVRSTIDRLAKSILSEKEYILGSVSYHDYNTRTRGMGNALSPIFSKRLSFEHEREVRLVHWATGEIGTGGITAPCETETLIEEIVVSPYAPSWVSQTIAAVIAKLGYSFPVRNSTLMTRPF